MQNTESSMGPKRTRRTNHKPAASASKPAARVAPRVSADERRSMIAESAYLRAERRGSDWVLTGIKRFVPFAHAADLILDHGVCIYRHDALQKRQMIADAIGLCE